jgi:tetratricopeptide (TPR) repeat protein
VLRLGAALGWRYWVARSREQEAFGLFVPVLRRPDAGDDPALFAAALTAAAGLACFIDVPTSRQLAEQAVQVARPLGDERLLRSALLVLCNACFFAGEPEAGRPFGQESVELARRLGDDVLLAESLAGYLLTVDPAGSGHLWAEAIACTERSGDHFINCLLRNNAGDRAFEAGDLPAARAHLEAAAQAGKQAGFPDTLVMGNLARVQRAEGDSAGARSTLEAVLRISRRNGNNTYLAGAILSLALLAGDAGDWNQAAVLHGAAEAFLDRAGSPWDESEARDRQDLLDRARAHLGDEQLERAHAQGRALSLEKALDLALGKAAPA